MIWFLKHAAEATNLDDWSTTGRWDIWSAINDGPIISHRARVILSKQSGWSCVKYIRMYSKAAKVPINRISTVWWSLWTTFWWKLQCIAQNVWVKKRLHFESRCIGAHHKTMSRFRCDTQLMYLLHENEYNRFVLLLWFSFSWKDSCQNCHLLSKPLKASFSARAPFERKKKQCRWDMFVQRGWDAHTPRRGWICCLVGLSVLWDAWVQTSPPESNF